MVPKNGSLVGCVNVIVLVGSVFNSGNELGTELASPVLRNSGTYGDHGVALNSLSSIIYSKKKCRIF